MPRIHVTLISQQCDSCECWEKFRAATNNLSLINLQIISSVNPEDIQFTVIYDEGNHHMGTRECESSRAQLGCETTFPTAIYS